MRWIYKYANVYCGGDLVKRVCVKRNNPLLRKKKLDQLFSEIQKAANFSHKNYYIELKVE